MVANTAPAAGPPELQGLQVTVAGLGLTGLAAVRFLVLHGARVTVSERKLTTELGDKLETLERLGAKLESGGNMESTFTSADLVIVSPGVPLAGRPLAAARAAGVPVWAEVELAFRFLRGRVIGITGSNGKSTTTAWTEHLLRHAGLDAVACGNLGVPLISLLEEDHPERYYVAELSSFQLEGIDELRPEIAVMTNVSPDHQDRYPSLDAYVHAKARLFENQSPDDHAILNADDSAVAGLADRDGGPKRYLFSAVRAVDSGAFVEEGRLQLRLEGKQSVLLASSELPLIGRHNVENALASALAAHLAGVATQDIAAGLRTFSGLPHRMEKVRTLHGVDWYNDSKATNLGATRAVVASLDRPLVLILGGRDKGADFSTLAELLPGRVQHLILMGEARGLIAAALAGVVPSTEVETMDEAVRVAADTARSGDAVLLAPACASFDAYGSFEERGNHFRELVLQLGVTGRG